MIVLLSGSCMQHEAHFSFATMDAKMPGVLSDCLEVSSMSEFYEVLSSFPAMLPADSSPGYHSSLPTFTEVLHVL